MHFKLETIHFFIFYFILFLIRVAILLFQAQGVAENTIPKLCCTTFVVSECREVLILELFYLRG